MQSKASPPPRRPSSSRDGLENSSLAQVLSQRLTNMEQQLFLLKDDLKNAVGTLKEKDREIQTLQNRIALAERRRELEETGKPVDESLKDVSEGVASKSNSKRDMLENDVVTLAKKLEEMEKFFGDYGLAWVKEDALDEKDPNNLWIRKSNIHYTPDFEKVFLVVEELNLGNAEPQIVRKGNAAQFKTAQLLNLTLYADGIQLENNPFRKYDSPSVEEFFRDLEDGYFPTELKGSHPEGVIFKVKDKRTINFIDDPDKRPVISRGAKPGAKVASPPSSPTSLSSLRVASRRSSTSSSPGRPGSSKGLDKNAEDGLLAASSSRKASSSKRRSSLKKTPSRPSRSSGDVKPKNASAEPKEKSDPTSDSTADDAGKSGPPSTPVPLGEDTGEQGKPGDATIAGDVPKPELSPDGKPSGDAANSQRSEGKRGDDIPGGGSPGVSADTSPGAVAPPGPSQQEKTDIERNFKELFRGKTPSSSALRLPERSVELTTEAQPKDAYGLPRPPFPSSSNTTADVRPLPLGPPSKQFENFPFPKTTETQTSLTLMPGVGAGGTPAAPPTPSPQPTHVTNITYNEAPITVQMTPSEFMRTKSGAESDAAHPPAMKGGIPCPTHDPHPCNCVRIPCDPCASRGEPTEGVFGSVGLAKFPAETEYRERFTESAINNQNVLDFKKRSQEAKGSHSPSPTPVPRQPAATLLVGPDEAPVPPDPVAHNLIDPNVKWEHFTFLGHPKDQEAVVTPEAPNVPNTKGKPSPQVVQLNEKTSDRMISVRMRTKSGSKEFLAHLYPDEPVSKVWSLLKMNERSHSLSTDDDKVVPSDTVATEISPDQVLRIVLSKNESSTVKTRFDPQKFPEFTAKDPEYFKTQADGKKKNRSDAKRIDDSARHKTDVRSLKDHIEEVKLMMKDDEKEDDDDGSRDIFISPHENRDWLSKEVYRKRSVLRVPSKELEKMLEHFKSQDNGTAQGPREAVAGEPTIVSISESQMGALKAAGRLDSSPPHIVLDDTGSVVSVAVPQRYKDIHQASDSKSRQSLSPEIDVNRSSSLVSESKIHVGSYVPEQRQKMKMTNPMKPPADYPGSVSSVDLHASSRKSSELTDVRAKSSHSLIFKRQTSAEDTVPRRRQSQSHMSLEDWKMEAGHDQDVGKTDFSEKRGHVAGDIHVDKQSHQSIQPPAASNQRDLERAVSKESAHGVSKKASDISSSGIGHDGFEAATLLEMVKAMLEAEKEHEKDQEKLRDAYRIVIPKPSPEPATHPQGFSVPEDVADELEALRQSLVKPVQATEPRTSPTQVDRAYIEQLLDEIRTKSCTLDEAIRELRKRTNSTL